jgi:hypothetical protein
MFRDSLLAIVNKYELPDVNEVNNYYTQKYENESYVIKHNTIDENILELIDKKRRIIESAIDGKETEKLSGDIEEIINKFM